MKKLGLIGEKLGHSYSKIIHERFFELAGKKDYSYDLIEIPMGDLPKEFKRIAGEYDGINVTIPYKLDVMEQLAFVSEEAKKIGAVNTVKFTPGGAYGYNSDYFGFKSTLENNAIEIMDKSVVILGTGGASKAALAVCEDMGAKEITFVTSGSKTVEGYKTLTYADHIKGDVLINCTPVGMYPKTGVSPIENLDTGFNAVVDMIYNPTVTELMKKGGRIGAKTVNGLNMLVAQGIYSESIWNGEAVDDEIVQTIFNELKEKF